MCRDAPLYAQTATRLKQLQPAAVPDLTELNANRGLERRTQMVRGVRSRKHLVNRIPTVYSIDRGDAPLNPSPPHCVSLHPLDKSGTYTGAVRQRKTPQEHYFRS